MLSDFIADLEDYEIVKDLGEGSFGIVYLVENKTSKKLFAAKILHELGDPKRQQSFFREIESFSKVKNPAVLSLIGFNLQDFKKYHRPTIITDYMPKGSLDELIKVKFDFSSSQKYIILLGIAKGMKYLHSLSIVHRDLKPSNVLIDDNFYPHICDFGESRYFDPKTQDDLLETSRGTYLYMAPEIMSGDLYTNKVDVYSFAITAYQIVTGKYEVYNNFRGLHSFMTKVLGGMRPDKEMVENEAIKRLLVKCWSGDPMERPTFDEILNEIMSDKFRKSMNASEREVSRYLGLFDDAKKTKQEQQTKPKQEQQTKPKQEQQTKPKQEQQTKPKQEQQTKPKQEQQTKPLFPHGKYYLVFTSKGEIATVSRTSQNPISCSSLSLRSSREVFTLINNSDGTISLKSEATGLYVSSSPEQGFRLIARGPSIESFEKFSLVPFTDFAFLIHSKANNKYVVVDQSDSCIMKATSDERSANFFAFYPVNDTTKGTFDMKTKTISFEGKTFKYEDEFIRSGSQLEPELRLLEPQYANRAYPQGIEYVKRLVTKQKEAQRTLIILGFSQNDKYVLFYFPFNRITELACEQGFRVLGNDDFDKEINLLHSRKDSCCFPQSWKHCLSFLEMEKKIGGCVRIANRCGNKPAFYFFEVNTSDEEDMNLLNYEYELWYQNNELNDLLSSLGKKHNLPQGLEYCRDVIQKRRDCGGRIHAIECSSTKTALFFKA